ncbi:MAG: CoA ester lyase [Erythrobacter sp.]|nr:CoA ester lyase [Erythrobacter sp.]
MRSWLVVAADDADALEQSAVSGADAVVIDLDHEMGASQREDARERAREWLGSHRLQVVEGRHFTRWVRISPLGSRHWRDDLFAVMPGAPQGIFLPEVPGPAHIQQLGAEFYEIEQRAGIAYGATQIVPMVASSPGGVLDISAFAGEPHPRLAGLAWDAAQLGERIDARRQRNERDEWCGAFAFARAQIILCAKAHGLKAVESGQPADTDPVRLERIAEIARADGFSGMFALHPEQISVINRAFTANEGEIAQARRIEMQFTANAHAELVTLGNRVLEPVDLHRARQVIEAAPKGRGLPLG